MSEEIGGGLGHTAIFWLWIGGKLRMQMMRAYLHYCLHGKFDDLRRSLSVLSVRPEGGRSTSGEIV